MNKPESAPAQAAKNGDSFRLLEKIGTEPKIYYRSRKDWVRQIASAPKPSLGKESSRG